MIMGALAKDDQTITLKTRRDGDITLSEYVRLSVDHYFEQLNGHPPNGLYALVIGEVEKPLVEAVLEHTNQNQTKAANALGLSRSTLRKKMIQYDIK